MDKQSNTPEGYNCHGCEKYHAFDVYVYAHTMDMLRHTCDCGAVHIIKNLKATLVKQKKGQRK